MNNLKVYSLLHLEEGTYSAVNFKPEDFKQQILTYYFNACNLANSLESFGLEYAIITNSESELLSIISGLTKKLKIIEINFCLTVPKKIKFYSAHYKIEAFKFLSKQKSGYHILMDVDMVMVNPISRNLDNLIKNNIPIVYDISNQLHAKDIHEDITKLSNSIIDPKWFGGEFISGSPNFFNNLSRIIERITDKYFMVYSEMNHTSDESITSTAINIMLQEGQHIYNGDRGIVNRYWSTNVEHKQKLLLYKCNSVFLHLPYDKYFLASISHRTFKPKTFLIKYLIYRFYKRLRILLKIAIERVLLNQFIS